MNSNTTNTILIILLVVIVGFGVWYFSMGRAAPAANDGPGLRVDIDGGNGGSGGGGSPDDDGTPDQGPGDR